jgi:hypothetical protein
VGILEDVESKIMFRPTIEFFETSVENMFSKFESEMDSKFEKKLKEIDCRDQINSMLSIVSFINLFGLEQ